jgi:NAD(P)-dependent dehydrogenase (short-subunit alcohol dehydrogenase family)
MATKGVQLMGSDFENRVAIVTGGASGMSLAAVRVFVEQGASLVIADISEEAGKEADSAIRDKGGKATFVHTDTGDQSSVAAMAQTAVRTYGKPDCAFNNAGASAKPRPSIEHTAAEWNLRGKMGDPAYLAAKAGVRGLVRAAAGEFTRQEIRVNTILPTITETPMYRLWASRVPERAKKTLEASARERAATAEEVTQSAVWLCSDAASFVSEVEIATDADGRYYQVVPPAEDSR